MISRYLCSAFFTAALCLSHPATAATQATAALVVRHDSTSSAISDVTDGPYIRWLGDTAVQVLSVCKGIARTSVIKVQGNVAVFEDPCAPGPVSVLSASPPPLAPHVVKNAKRVFAISDVEGRYDEMVALLRAAGVIDTSNRWAWGDGHLVLVGDAVDRGTKVTEVLWFLRRLESQAQGVGGAVHYLIGNHDAMLLYGDHRYVEPKYQQVASQLGVSLIDLYGPTTDLGRWMRTKPAMLLVDSVLFLHGGINPDFAAQYPDMAAVNAIIQRGLGEPALRKTDSVTALVMGSKGPLWYRGYFENSPPVQAIQESIGRYGASRVVVGHTVVDSITAMHDGCVIAIDVTFTNIDKVQGLLIDHGKFYRVNVKGERTALD